MNVFVKRSLVEVPPAAVEAWHARPGSLRRLVPPWERLEVVERWGGPGEGGRTVLRVGLPRLRWVSEHHDLYGECGFRDVQVEGPFARWDHTHRFSAADPVPRAAGAGDNPSSSGHGGQRSGSGSRARACILEDRIEYELPFGFVGRRIGGRYVRRRLERMFAWRHRTTAHDLELHQRYDPGRPLRILVTGASGFIGSALVAFLMGGGHQVVRLVRRPPAGPDEVRWDPAAGGIDRSALRDLGVLDAVVHLAGESLGGVWTAGRRQWIRDSRVHGTRLLSETLAGLSPAPEVLACASAIGYYGDRGDEPLTEESPPGDGFMADVCRAWEAAADPARAAGIRVVHLRMGVVLDPAGGALGVMLPAFRLGLGVRLGSGRQYMSWITRNDALAAFLHALRTPGLAGPVNAVAPAPLHNATFTRVLAHVLRRPAWLSIPAPILRLLPGDMADEMLLSSACVVPMRLRQTGFTFGDPQIDPALRHLLGRLRPATVVPTVPSTWMRR